MRCVTWRSLGLAMPRGRCRVAELLAAAGASAAALVAVSAGFGLAGLHQGATGVETALAGALLGGLT